MRGESKMDYEKWLVINKDKIKPKIRLPVILTEEDLLKLLRHPKIKKHHKFAFALGFYECMRISEITKLKLENINFDTKLIHVIQGKGGKDRMIPISKSVIRGFKTHIPMKCGIRALEIAFKNACKKVLNKDSHFHCLRHSGITYYLVKKRWSSLDVMRLAGHSRITTTQIYAHIQPEDLVDRMWNE